MKKWLAIPALAGVVVLGGVAMTVGAEKSDIGAVEEFLTIEEAKAKAVEAVGGKVTEIEFEREKSGEKYEIEVKSDGVEYDLDIDAKTGEVLRTKQDDYDDRSHLSNEELLTVEEAIAIVMKQAKGTVTEVELDDGDGGLHYEIEVEDGTFEYDFEIDAVTGEVLKFEKEREDD